MTEQECSDIAQQPAQIDGDDRIVPAPQQPEANGKEPVASSNTTEQQPKARSGYGRLRRRHYNLIAEHESLQAEYHAVRKELVEWRGMYLQLKSDLEAIGCGKEMSHG